MQKIFSKEILWKEEGLNYLIEKIENILINNNSLIISFFKLCLLLIEDNHPSIMLKNFEIIKKLFNYIKDNKIEILLENNIIDGVLYKIKKKLNDINIKIRTKACLLYSFLMSLGNIYDFNKLIEDLIKYEDINKSNNLIISKLDILINIFHSNEQEIKNKLNEANFPSVIIMEYLIDNLNNNINNNEIRKKIRLCIKLFFDIYDLDKFKNFLDKIDKKELNELIKDIPKLQNIFPEYKNNETIIVKKNDINNNKKYKIKIEPSKKNKKLLFKTNKSFSLKNKQKVKNN